MSYKDAGSFVPTTQLWEASRLKEVNVTSPEFKELLVRLYQNINQIAIGLNNKETGIFDTEEFVTGSTFFPNTSLSSSGSTTAIRRQVYRKVINIPAMRSSAGATTYAHGITFDSKLTWTRIYGTATDSTGFIGLTIPSYSAVAADIVTMNVDATNVNITVGKDMSAYKAFIVLEWIIN